MTRGAPALVPEAVQELTDRPPSWDDLDGVRIDADSRRGVASGAGDPPADGSDTDADAEDGIGQDGIGTDQKIGGVQQPPNHDAATRAALSTGRIQALQKLLRARRAGGVLLSERRNFSWLTVGGTAHVLQSSEAGVASVLVTPSGASVLTSTIEADRILAEEIAGLELAVETFDWFAEGGALAVARARIKGSLLTDADVEEQVQPQRSLLSPLEQARMAWLGDRVRDALDQALEGVEPDEPEDFLAADATMILGDAGIRVPVVLAAADDRIDRYRHPLAGRDTIQRRVMLVLVGERWGLHVAATSIRELDEPSADVVRRTRAVDRVLTAMVDATREGATLGSVFATAQRTYRTVGFPDEWRLHHQGGSIGYSSRERVAVPGDPTPIRAGMAFAWNPSITGTKAETTFILREGGEVRVLV